MNREQFNTEIPVEKRVRPGSGAGKKKLEDSESGEDFDYGDEDDYGEEEEPQKDENRELIDYITNMDLQQFGGAAASTT